MSDNWMRVSSFSPCNLDVFSNFFESRGAHSSHTDFVVVYVNILLHLVERIFVDVSPFLSDHCSIN